jgi:hypothetical protein
MSKPLALQGPWQNFGNLTLTLTIGPFALIGKG